MDVKIDESWRLRLKDEFEKDYFIKLAEFVKNEYKNGPVYPPGGLIFNALNLCPFDNVKAVIIGQDPYHGPGQAHGLCFSVKDGVDFPPSLKNIFKEIEMDIGIKRPVSGNLKRWSSQGVLLLNATLTVRAHMAGSHQKKGWEQFTDSVIMHRKKENQSTGQDILFLNRYTPLLFLLQEVFSGTTISADATFILLNTVLFRLTGSN
jgi:uracil-DNA glycosylase